MHAEDRAKELLIPISYHDILNAESVTEEAKDQLATLSVALIQHRLVAEAQQFSVALFWGSMPNRTLHHS